MSRKLVNLNPDLKRLADEGYAIRCLSGYLIVSHIPYLNSQRQVAFGTLVSALTLVSENQIGPPQDHQLFWCGEQPCNLDGSPITQLGGGPNITDFGNDLRSSFLWSNKPPEGFTDFFAKIESYSNIVAGPAMELDPKTTPKCFIELKSDDPDSPFHFPDTMSSRAGIFDLNRPFEGLTVSIIGLGGTGSYVLDFVAKMPVAEIRLFDDDKFFVHNAFRRPGSTVEQDFERPKVEMFADAYGTFHKNIRPFQKRITSDDHNEVLGSSFVFVCVDRGASRLAITRALMDLGIPFADVGMGLSRTGTGLAGLIRTTLVTGGEWNNLVDGGLLPIEDAQDDVYSSNIQIGELNALNACLAVMQFKRLFGFYEDDETDFHSLFNIGSLSIVTHGEDDEDD